MNSTADAQPAFIDQEEEEEEEEFGTWPAWPRYRYLALVNKLLLLLRSLKVIKPTTNLPSKQPPPIQTLTRQWALIHSP